MKKIKRTVLCHPDPWHGRMWRGHGFYHSLLLHTLTEHLLCARCHKGTDRKCNANPFFRLSDQGTELPLLRAWSTLSVPLHLQTLTWDPCTTSGSLWRWVLWHLANILRHTRWINPPSQLPKCAFQSGYQFLSMDHSFLLLSLSSLRY